MNFYVWTNHGHLLKVDGAPDANAAMRQIREMGQYGAPLQVMDETEFRDYNRVPKHICRLCGEPKNLCGGWCQIPEASW
jgi:hypothetical protein